ncbi:MAG: hypothetical protein O3B13_01705 [Planctomycetota bacterium]|nr:hypothetical protein [Planctomycetota bacterium]
MPRATRNDERDEIPWLSEHVPPRWHAATATPQDRQAIARLLLGLRHDNIEGDSERVDVEGC